MANNPESLFIQSVHRRLKQLSEPPIIRKLADRFTQGWPDVLYIGVSGQTLWVEYKVHPNKTSPLQKETISTLRKYRQNIAVITKMPTDYAIHNGETNIQHATPWTWIAEQLGYSTCK